MHPYHNLPFLAVSGLGRSGTTVLRNCVAAHPEIHALNRESNYLFTLMRNANLTIEDERIVNNLAVEPDLFWQEHRELILRLCWPDVDHPVNLPKAISTYTSLDPRAAMGLKETFDIHSLIYTVRNGIEVVSSFQSFDAFKHLSFEEACRVWSLRYDMFQYCRDNEHAFLVRYEWLSEDLELWEAVLGQCLQKAGLEFHPDCRQPLAKRYHPTRFAGESRHDFKDPNKRKERWRLWTAEQRSLFSEICGQRMENLGYPIPWT